MQCTEGPPVFPHRPGLVRGQFLVPWPVLVDGCLNSTFLYFSLRVAAQAFQAIDIQLGARHRRRTPTIHRGSAQRTISAGSLAAAGWDSSMCSTGGTLLPKPNS